MEILGGQNEKSNRFIHTWNDNCVGWLGGCNLPTAPVVVDPPLINEPIVKDCNYDTIIDIQIQPECGVELYEPLPRSFRYRYDGDLENLQVSHTDRHVSFNARTTRGDGARYVYYEENDYVSIVSNFGIWFRCYPKTPLSLEDLKRLEFKSVIVYGLITDIRPIENGRPMDEVIIRECIFSIQYDLFD